ncbi:hypothetical protein ACH5RR_037756 [Cinchona calisaya]|uniref:Putative plant transposon protein domain-containing protein n=1 Tax=Cinchona calisaya TaxID=153742 RepID=A0ABD2Y754_9GENT
MGNKRKALNSTALVDSNIVHYQSHEPKVVLDKYRFVSVETHMFYDKLALIASPCLERGLDFYGLGDDKFNTLTAPGEVCHAFLSEISDRTWYRFVREDATVANDTLVREFIANTHKLTDTVVQHAIFKRSDINYDMLLRELCDPHVPDGMAKWEFYLNGKHKQFLKTWLSSYALVWYHFLTSRILPINHLTKVTRDRVVLLYALVKDWSIDIGLEIQMEILCNGAKDQPSFIFPNLITSLCTKEGVTLRTGSKISPDKPITGPWICLPLKKHDNSLQDLIAKKQPRAQAKQIVLNSQNHDQQGIWELQPPVHPDYVFRRSHTEVELCSLAVYHSRSLHSLHHKLDILAHQLPPAQPLNLANWSLEPDAPSWHFGLLADDDYGPGSKESEDE